MATLFLTKIIRYCVSLLLVFRLPLTTSLLESDSLRQKLIQIIKVPRHRYHIRAHYQGFAAPISAVEN
ncbi:predicted protein [Enterococcus faecium 1,231,410]|nr:predicted protein [Enterococcus faecium 1,231,410]